MSVGPRKGTLWDGKVHWNFHINNGSKRIEQQFDQIFEKKRCGVEGQFSSVVQSCLTVCDPMNCNTPGLSVHHHLPEFTQTHVHRVGDAIQPSHPLSSPSSPAPNPSQHQSLIRVFSSESTLRMSWPSTGVSALASFLPKNTQG